MGIFFLYAGVSAIGYIIVVFVLDRVLGVGIQAMLREQLNLFSSRKQSQGAK
jgi:hypothetical protein